MRWHHRWITSVLRRTLPVLAALAVAAVWTAPARAQQTQPKVIGGQAAAQGSWPSIVALVRHTATNDWNGQFCGGTLVAAQWVLTAAHCVEARAPGDVDVLAGTQTLDRNARAPSTAVSEIRVHPARNTVTRNSDLALLRVAAPLGQPVLPVPGPSVAALWAEGRTARVAGWGTTTQNGVDFPTDLVEAAVPLVSDGYCGRPDIYGEDYRAAVMLCAGDVVNGGVDSCQGDSGGPLVVADAAGRTVLAGSTSYGNGCAQPGYPGVYGEIAGMREFVDQTIGWTTGASASTGALSFEANALGAPTAPQTVTVTSAGSAPLSIASVALTGAGASQFGVVSDGCSLTVLTTGQQCGVAVRATPAAADAGGQLLISGDGAIVPVALSLHVAPAAPPPVARLTVPSPVAPNARVRVLAPRRGVHRLRVTLDRAGTVTATLTRRVRRHGRATTVKLATASATLRAAGTRTLALRLTAAGRRALAHGARVKATATVVTRNGTAHRTVKRALTLR